MGWHGAGGYWFFWPIGWLVFLFLIFGVGRWLFWGRGWWGGFRGGPYGYYHGAWGPQGDRSLAILRERLARGEIDHEEYDRVKGQLER